MSDRSWRQAISIGCAIPPFLSFCISESAGTLIFVSAYICLLSMHSLLIFISDSQLPCSFAACFQSVISLSINNLLSPFELALVLLSSLVSLSHTRWPAIMPSPLQAPHILFYYYNREPVHIYSTWASNFSTSPLLIF